MMGVRRIAKVLTYLGSISPRIIIVLLSPPTIILSVEPPKIEVDYASFLPSVKSLQGVLVQQVSSTRDVFTSFHISSRLFLYIPVPRYLSLRNTFYSERSTEENLSQYRTQC